MTKLILGAFVLLAAIGQVSPATAQTSPPPPPTPANLQSLPWWFVKHQYRPGAPWFYRASGTPAARQCRVAYWYLAQFSGSDQWGNTSTWMSYAPQYVCD